MRPVDSYEAKVCYPLINNAFSTFSFRSHAQVSVHLWSFSSQFLGNYLQRKRSLNRAVENVDCRLQPRWKMQTEYYIPGENLRFGWIYFNYTIEINRVFVYRRIDPSVRCLCCFVCFGSTHLLCGTTRYLTLFLVPFDFSQRCLSADGKTRINSASIHTNFGQNAGGVPCQPLSFTEIVM